MNYATLPTCTSELDARNGREGGRRHADLMDLAMGLRAMVKNQLPAPKPTLNVVEPVTHLPRQTKELAVAQETANWERKLSSRKCSTKWAGQLAEAELSVWADHARTWQLQQEVEGNRKRLGNDLDHGPELRDLNSANQLAAEELREWLVLHLTAKEVEALEQRANGQAQRDASGHTLKRAQRKARAAMGA